MEDKTAPILILLTVLVLIYLSRSGKLVALKALLASTPAVAQTSGTQGNSGPANTSGNGGIDKTVPGTWDPSKPPIQQQEADQAIADIEAAFRGWQAA